MKWVKPNATVQKVERPQRSRDRYGKPNYDVVWRDLRVQFRRRSSLGQNALGNQVQVSARISYEVFPENRILIGDRVTIEPMDSPNAETYNVIGTDDVPDWTGQPVYRTAELEKIVVE